MSKRKQALEAMELDGPPLTLVAHRQGRRPGRLAVDRMRPNPDQPRRSVDQTAVLQLAADIAERGLLQPIVVGPPDDTGIHTIIAGERRWRACQKAEKQVADVVIDYDLDDPETMFDAALAENIQREDLTRPDLAAALIRVKREHSLTDEQLGVRYNKSTEWVRQVLAFAGLQPEAQDFMENRKLPIALAKAVQPLDAEHQLEVLHAIEPLSNRDEQLAMIQDLKGMVRRGAESRAAVATVEQHVQNRRAEPARLTYPFVWNEAGDVRFLRVQFSALAQMRLTRTRSGPFESWVDALTEDLTALRDACADEASGADAWAHLVAKVRAVVDD